jgi:hypothetical protein
MDRIKMAGCVAAVVTAGVVGIAFPGKAAPSKTPAPVVGFVDLGLVTDQIKQTPNWKVMVTKFEDAKTKYRDEIEGLVRHLGANPVVDELLDIDYIEQSLRKWPSADAAVSRFEPDVAQVLAALAVADFLDLQFPR